MVGLLSTFMNFEAIKYRVPRQSSLVIVLTYREVTYSKLSGEGKSTVGFHMITLVQMR